MTKLNEKIATAFLRTLDVHGYAKVQEKLDAKNFGNEIIVFQSPNAQIRFTSDRSDFIVEIRSVRQNATWHELSTLLEFLKLSAVGNASVSFADLGIAFAEHYPQIEKEFLRDSPQFESALTEYERVRSRQIMEKLRKGATGEG